MDSVQGKQLNTAKLVLISLAVGLILACASIVVNKKTNFQYCDFSPQQLHVVDRGAPFKYFKVTPSESVCDPVDNVGAVIATNVGNDVNKNAFFADWLIWSLVAGVALAVLHARKSKKPASASQ